MVNYLLEIGTEELPADFIDGAIAQWQTSVPQSLAEHFFEPTQIEYFGTPRRLAILIHGLPPQQSDREEEIKGPPASIGYKDGAYTQAALGFAKKQGVSVEALSIKATEKGDFIFAQKFIPGRPTGDVLQELVLPWIQGLQGRRFMRWGDGELRFPRPIVNLVSLLDGEVLPLTLVNGSTTIAADRTTRGHRVLSPHEITLAKAADYVQTLQAHHIEVALDRRHQLIQAQINTLANTVNGVATIPAELLAEVANLVESPHGVLGNFDAEFLELPQEVTTMVMIKHQRYFPVHSPTGELLPYFITISNGDPDHSALIAKGNERVLRARLADGQFFYTADCDQHLAEYVPELEKVTFQEELGSIADKVDRIMAIAEQCSDQLDLSDDDHQAIASTAMLCKADLVTQMVYEFPELQGIMGEKYALKSGEPALVAKGIVEHYLPKGAGDDLPDSITGQIVGISDRLDTVVSIFGIGQIPTGSSDPFALRRAANGIIHIIWHGALELDLLSLLTQASQDFLADHSKYESPLPKLIDFFNQRVQTLLQEDLGIDYDLVNAIFGNEGLTDYRDRALAEILETKTRAKFLQGLRQNQTLDRIYETVNRSTRLAAKGDLGLEALDPTAIVNPDLFEKSSEQALYDGLNQLLPLTLQAQAEDNYELLINGLIELAPIVARFFDGDDSVMVMAEDANIKANRLNLLGCVRNHSLILADFSEIVI